MTADQSGPVPRASVVGSIDREALIELLWDQGAVGEAYHRRDGAEWLAERILGLVRPVEGVTVPREDVPDVVSGLRWASLHPIEGAPASWGIRWRALADRLEARS